MKKGFLVLFSLIALMGILNCVLLEPAFAYKEDEVACQTGNESHCCFICHSSHHQWSHAQASSLNHPLFAQEGNFIQSNDFLIAPPVQAIFHPPTAI